MQNNGAFAVKSNVNKKIVGLKAPFIQLIPDLGLVGFEIHGGWEQRDAYKNGKINVALGRVIWQLNLATGEVKGIEKDEVVMFNPYHRIYSTRLLYLGQNTTTTTTNELMAGYFLEDNKVKRKWDNLSVMAPPRSTAPFKPQEKRYYRYWDNHIQIADKKEGETYEIIVFDDKLQEKNSYYPSLLVYRNYDIMPNFKTSSVSHISGKKLVEDYRSGKGFGPDELFHRQALIPSQDIEGLYGVLRADGTVEIPEGSLGLSPVITEEKDAKSKTGATYLLSHYFIVAYPGDEDGNMNFAKSTDGGLTWSRKETEINYTFIPAQNGNRLFCLTEGWEGDFDIGNAGGLFYSDNLGDSWQQSDLNYAPQVTDREGNLIACKSYQFQKLKNGKWTLYEWEGNFPYGVKLRNFNGDQKYADIEFDSSNNLYLLSSNAIYKTKLH